MKAMVLEKAGRPLTLRNIDIPIPSKNQVRIKVVACSVCRTDLHILDGELRGAKMPLVMGHQIVGTIDSESTRFKNGTLIGVPWLGKSCGACFYCKNSRENLCDDPIFTGYTINGGFAEYCVADERFIFPIPEGYSPVQAAPLLCAGMIGYRSLKMTKGAKRLGFYGFGSAAHLLLQVALYQGKEVYAFTKPGDAEGQSGALKRGATWAGDSETSPPKELDGAIIFAPVGSLIPTALKAVRKGGIVVCAGIHMSDIPSFPYEILWGERVLASVANLTREDGEEFLALAAKIPIKTEVTTYPLEKTNEALKDLKEGKIVGSAVITL